MCALVCIFQSMCILERYEVESLVIKRIRCVALLGASGSADALCIDGVKTVYGRN